MNMNSAPGMGMPPQQPPMPLQTEALKEPSMAELVDQMYAEGRDIDDLYSARHLAHKKKLAKGPLKKRKLH